MTVDELSDIHIKALERYAEIFGPDEADAYACGWWIWANRALPKMLYEEVRKKRWKSASKIEKLVAKREVPQS